ncbi:MAG: DUF6932 family protein [Chloroflexota bacterium]
MQVVSVKSPLWAKLTDFVREVAIWDFIEVVLVDGSFVTAAPEPNDVDLVLVVSANHDFTEDLQLEAYNVLSNCGLTGALVLTFWLLGLIRRNTAAT